MKTLTLYYALPNEADESQTDSHALRLAAAADYAHTSPSDFAESLGKHGKPYFSSHPNVCFSVSHSGGIWVCALSDIELGFDVQVYDKNSTPDRRQRIAKRWFSPEEYRFFEERGHDEATFYELWTKKEAYVKLTGDGIAFGAPPSFDTTRPIGDCIIRSLTLPCPVPHAASVAARYEFDDIRITRVRTFV